MLCERCGKNPATTYFKEIINGKARELHLCARCAAELSSQLMPGLGALSDFGIGNLLGSLFTQTLPQAGTTEEKRCRYCGCSLSELARNGQVGCPHCYQEFYQQLLPSIERIHGKTRHVGKVPRSASGGLRLHRQMEDLKRQLDEAVGAQAYEKAARLRDQIRELEGKGAFHSSVENGGAKNAPDGKSGGDGPEGNKSSGAGENPPAPPASGPDGPQGTAPRS